MEKDFLDDLDTKLSNIGTDVVWKETIGGRLIWISPPSQDANMKINEVMTSEDLGIHTLSETKRTTMSYAIVGIGSIDLRKHEKFGPFKTKGGKDTFLNKQRYLYLKMQNWGSQWIDSAFEVFSDRMTSLEKENIKDIKFDNVKDEREELIELEERVQAMRIDQGLPPLVEESGKKIDDIKDDEVEDPEFGQGFESSEVIEDEEDIEESPKDEVIAFDPFKPKEQVVEKTSPPIEAPKIVPPAPNQERTPLDHPESKLSPRIQQRVDETNQIEGGSSSSIEGKMETFHGLPSTPEEVVETKQTKIEKEKVIVDQPPKGGVNPRFKPPPSI